MDKILLIFLLFAITACARTEKRSFDYDEIGKIHSKDYVDFLASTGQAYVGFEEIKTVKMPTDVIQFLENIYDRIVTNNQQLLTSKERPTFYFIKHPSPFLFSLPKSQFYFSSSLIEKYLKSEELFVAAFAAEILRSQRNIYEKNILVPLGFYTTEKMLQITKLKFETKIKVNEWAYYILKRAGYDSSAYLNWIQIQNRNTLDFALYVGDQMGITREEHLFKNYITTQGGASADRRFSEANSSKDFYKMLNILMRK